MKKILRALGLTMVLSLAACGSAGPQDQLKTIDELMGKNFPMTQKQRTDLDKYLADGKRLLQEGEEAESSKAFGEAIKILKTAEDTALFNKSE
ncbi:MAG: hypothetical protein BMS9Abin10_0593 [Gammaproteobacteria bacterium]|nr:MAG: hypothetical protein BMS9Abin10_0593 [Gammaproteobacteria bacterium]